MNIYAGKKTRNMGRFAKAYGRLSLEGSVVSKQINWRFQAFPID